MKNIAVKILVAIAFIGFLFMAADCENMNTFYLSKIVGAIIFAISIIGIRIINAKSKYHKY